MTISAAARIVPMLALCMGPVSLTTADEPAPPPSSSVSSATEIARSSDLSTALPPGDWIRVEEAVDQGLAWLATQQLPDGRFPSNEVGQPAVTSLAVMAFLSRGHLPGQGEYGEHLNRAIDFVLDHQSRRGYFSFLRVPPSSTHMTPGHTLIYNHTIAGLMLGEVYGMTSGERSQRIAEALERALAFSRSVQSRGKAFDSERGGWRYAYPDSPAATSDLSVTGWALMFYRSARNAEFGVPKEYVDEGLDFVERCYVEESENRDRGMFRYRPLDAEPASRTSLANTGSGMLALLLGGRHDSRQVRECVAWYLGRPYPTEASSSYFYLAAYYSSQAMGQVGGDAWNRVYPQIAEMMLARRSPEGGWPAGVGNEVSFGPCYATALAVLALTPPYQLLPIYQR